MGSAARQRSDYDDGLEGMNMTERVTSVLHSALLSESLVRLLTRNFLEFLSTGQPILSQYLYLSVLVCFLKVHHHSLITRQGCRFRISSGAVYTVCAALPQPQREVSEVTI